LLPGEGERKKKKKGGGDCKKRGGKGLGWNSLWTIKDTRSLKRKKSKGTEGKKKGDILGHGSSERGTVRSHEAENWYSNWGVNLKREASLGKKSKQRQMPAENRLYLIKGQKKEWGVAGKKKRGMGKIKQGKGGVNTGR